MKTCMCAGSLRHRVVIQSATRGRDAVGGQVDTWGTHATVWASIEPMGTGEQWRRHQMEARADFRVGIRYLATVTTKMRVTYDGRTFEIRGIKDPDMRKQYLELACEELHAS